MTPSNQNMRNYLFSLGILFLGLWALEGLLIYEAASFFFAYGLGPSWEGWTLAFMITNALNLIVGMVIIAVPSGVFAALLYVTASHHTRPAGQRAILASSSIFAAASGGLTLTHVLTGGWPWSFDMLILFSAPFMLGYYLEDMTWQQAITNPLGLQLLLTPILLSGCMVVGRLSRRRGAATDDFGD